MILRNGLPCLRLCPLNPCQHVRRKQSLLPIIARRIPDRIQPAIRRQMVADIDVEVDLGMQAHCFINSILCITKQGFTIHKWLCVSPAIRKLRPHTVESPPLCLFNRYFARHNTFSAYQNQHKDPPNTSAPGPSDSLVAPVIWLSSSCDLPDELL